MKRINKDRGMFEFVFVCTSVFFLLGVRAQEGVIDKRFADDAREECWKILDDDHPNHCDRLSDWAIRCYNIPGLIK